MNPEREERRRAEAGSRLRLTIPEEMEGLRVDQAMARLLPRYSRSAIQGWLRAGHVTLGKRALKPSDRLAGAGPLEVFVPPQEPAEWLAQPMELDLVYRDADILVVDKPAGLVVHPGAGNPDGTLLNGLLALDDSLRLLPRAGIVHRLDKDTSGLMVVALNESARQDLVDQLSARSVSRRYLAVTCGVPVAGETIDQDIGRHPGDRIRMAVRTRAKPAITHVRVVEKFRAHALVEARLETGRTHQIRVHLAWRGFPLVGDPLYGGRLKIPPDASAALARALQDFRRQALHATELSLDHPGTRKRMTWERPPPEDFRHLLDTLGEDLRRADAK